MHKDSGGISQGSLRVANTFSVEECSLRRGYCTFNSTNADEFQRAYGCTLRGALSSFLLPMYRPSHWLTCLSWCRGDVLRGTCSPAAEEHTEISLCLGDKLMSASWGQLLHGAAPACVPCCCPLVTLRRRARPPWSAPSSGVRPLREPETSSAIGISWILQHGSLNSGAALPRDRMSTYRDGSGMLPEPTSNAFFRIADVLIYQRSSQGVGRTVSLLSEEDTIQSTFRCHDACQ